MDQGYHRNTTTNTHTGTQNTGVGAGNTGIGSSNYGPHDSNIGNKMDPRVDSDLGMDITGPFVAHTDHC